MKGFLIINLGSPDELTLKDTKKFLTELLSDDYVIDLPKFLQKILVKGLIVPLRSKKTLKAYETIWTKKGSPLRRDTDVLAQQLEDFLKSPVRAAMRYRHPSLTNAIQELIDLKCREIKVLPLYPQYSSSTSLSSIQATKETIEKIDSSIKLEFINCFYDTPDYIDILSKHIIKYLPSNFDHLLFSYHGLPKRQIIKSDPSGSHCLRESNCCEKTSNVQKFCYKYQAIQTSKLCAQKLKLKPHQWSIAFQSNIGPGWLKPSTKDKLKSLPHNGKKNIAVGCPSFYIDNLETLEEISIRGKEVFKNSGGDDFSYIPCLNYSKESVRFLSSILLS